MIGGIFDDLPAAFAAIEAAATVVDARVNVEISEAREGADPLAHLRARTPRPTSA